MAELFGIRCTLKDAPDGKVSSTYLYGLSTQDILAEAVYWGVCAGLPPDNVLVGAYTPVEEAQTRLEVIKLGGGQSYPDMLPDMLVRCAHPIVGAPTLTALLPEHAPAPASLTRYPVGTPIVNGELHVPISLVYRNLENEKVEIAERVRNALAAYTHKIPRASPARYAISYRSLREVLAKESSAHNRAVTRALLCSTPDMVDVEPRRLFEIIEDMSRAERNAMRFLDYVGLSMAHAWLPPAEVAPKLDEKWLRHVATGAVSSLEWWRPPSHEGQVLVSIIQACAIFAQKQGSLASFTEELITVVQTCMRKDYNITNILLEFVQKYVFPLYPKEHPKKQDVPNPALGVAVASADETHHLSYADYIAIERDVPSTPGKDQTLMEKKMSNVDAEKEKAAGIDEAGTSLEKSLLEVGNTPEGRAVLHRVMTALTAEDKRLEGDTRLMKIVDTIVSDVKIGSSIVAAEAALRSVLMGGLGILLASKRITKKQHTALKDLLLSDVGIGVPAALIGLLLSAPAAWQGGVSLEEHNKAWLGRAASTYRILAVTKLGGSLADALMNPLELLYEQFVTPIEKAGQVISALGAAPATTRVDSPEVSHVVVNRKDG